MLGDYDVGVVRHDWERAAELMDGMGVDDGGAELCAWTCAFLAPHLDLIFRVADALWDLKALDGCEIDAILSGEEIDALVLVAQ